MKRIILIMFAVMLLVSCRAGLFEFDIPRLGFTSIESVLSWTSTNIRYAPDARMHYPRLEYWQSPDQTYLWRAGDCEDYTILAMYFMHTELFLEPRMVAGWSYSKGHAWLRVNGRDYDPQNGRDVTSDPNYIAGYTLSYDEAIRRSTTTHRTLED